MCISNDNDDYCCDGSDDDGDVAVYDGADDKMLLFFSCLYEVYGELA